VLVTGHSAGGGKIVVCAGKAAFRESFPKVCSCRAAQSIAAEKQCQRPWPQVGDLKSFDFLITQFNITALLSRTIEEWAGQAQQGYKLIIDVCTVFS
jgi:hypothetical protein